MTRRYEFPKSVKREAVRRAGGRCEATGAVYGLPPGHRCNGDLGRGLEIDHYPIPATEAGSDTIDNAVVCCTVCHREKTRTFDIPVQAKTKRVSDAHLGVTKKSGFATNRNGKWKRKMNGEIVRRAGS